MWNRFGHDGRRGLGGFSALAACAVLAASAWGASPALAATVISAGEDGKVRFWSTENGDLVRTLDAHAGKVLCVAASADGTRIATGGEDGNVKLWKAADGSAIRTIEKAHEGGVTAIAFAANGNVVTGGADKRVKTWNGDGGMVSSLGGHEEPLVSVFQSGDFLVSADRGGKLLVRNPAGEELVGIETGHAGGLTANVSNPVQPATYTGGKDGAVKYWSQEAQGDFDGGQGSAVLTMAVTRDGARVASGGADGKVRVWDTATMKAVATIDTGIKDGVTAIAFSADGAVLFVGGADGKGQARDAATGDLLGQVDAHKGRVTGIASLE
jgi:WD40 repeat protein